MPSDVTRFEPHGTRWSDLAQLGELDAVLSPGSPERANLFLHALTLYAAKVALALDPNKRRKKGILVDFGCGTGRFVRFFGARGYSVIGLDITPEMLSAARKFGLPQGSDLQLTDGVSIPCPDQSVDMIWICGVLKYGLFVHPFLEFELQQDPAYPRIAKEMYRVLKPGGFVANYEIFVNNVQPEVFTRDFEQAGFITKDVRILQRYGRLEWHCQWSRLPLKWLIPAGQVCAALHYWFDDPKRPAPGLRDYLFVWCKQNA